MGCGAWTAMLGRCIFEACIDTAQATSSTCWVWTTWTMRSPCKSQCESLRRESGAAGLRQYSSLSIVDLPCQACRYSGVFASARTICGCGEHDTIEWLLKRLPGAMDALTDMGWPMKHATFHLEGKGDGLDRQAAGFVIRVWLKQNHAPSRSSMCSARSRGRKDMFPIAHCVLPRVFSTHAGLSVWQKEKQN